VRTSAILHRIPRHAAVHHRRQGRWHPGRGRVIVEEREAVPRRRGNSAWSPSALLPAQHWKTQRGDYRRYQCARL